MKLFSTEAKVGIVVLAALAALTWLTFQVGEFRFRKRGYVIEAVFRTVSGLEPQAKVRMAGVLVGGVERIFLKDGMAHALLRVDDGVVVHEDSVVSVAAIGILSERYIEITAGSPGARALAPGALIAGHELTDLDQMMAELVRTSETIRALAASVSQSFGGPESSVGLLLRHTDELVTRVSALLEDNRRRVGELLGQSAGLAADTRAFLAENRSELHATISALRSFSESLDRRAEELTAEAKKAGEELRGAVRGGREDFQGLVASLRAAADRAGAAADDLGAILKKVERGEGTLGRLVNDTRTIDRVDAAVGQIGGIAEKINSGQGSLGRLVTDDTLVRKAEGTMDSANRFLGETDRLHFYLGYRGEYLTRREDVKNYVSVKLQPRPDKYYLLELVDDPAGRRSITTTTSRITRPDGGYELTEHTVTTEEGKLKFTLLFAKDFGDLTFRGGLMESQGGAGLDYHLFGDRLRVSVDGWDFSRDEGPHYKATGRLRLYKDVFVNAGVDDLAESRRRSLFLGAGILFSDEDLKYLLSLSRLSQ